MTPQKKAQRWLRDNCLIMDTETTGLGDDAEIVEISLIDTTGEILLNTLVKPRRQIPPEATAIHGITNEMVADAPSWIKVCSKFYHLINGRNVVIYNSDYDTRLLEQTNAANWIVGPCFIEPPVFECAMLAYAEFYGQKSDRGGYKWQKLTAAAAQQGVTLEGTPHRALSDCLTTLGVIKAMARFEIGQYITELKEEIKQQRQRIEHLEHYKAGIISIVNACNETYPSPVPFSEGDVLRIVDLIRVDDIPFGAVEQDHEVAQLQRQVDEKDLLLQQAKENERRAMDCFARAVAFAKGAEGDPCYITALAKEVADLVDEERKQ